MLGTQNVLNDGVKVARGHDKLLDVTLTVVDRILRDFQQTCSQSSSVVCSFQNSKSPTTKIVTIFFTEWGRLFLSG